MVAFTILLAVIALYLYLTRNFNYWAKRGIKHDKPWLLFGNNIDGYLMKKSISQIAEEMYWKFPNERVVGFYRSSRPELIVRDPEIVKRILINDFRNFYNRGLIPSEGGVEPLMQNLFFADGDVWRLLRQRMTSAFTSGKLRGMFPLLSARARLLGERSATAAGGEPVDARDLMARYTTDCIGAVGFGVRPDSLDDPNSPFRRLGASIFDIGLQEVLVAIAKEMCPRLTSKLRYLERIEKDLTNLVKDILRTRNYKPSGRNDFVDLLLELRKRGTMVGESLDRTGPDGRPARAELILTDELIAAQIFVFFAAGFETSSSATSFTLHQLAHHPAVQARVHEEVDRVLAAHDGELSYEAVKKMTYLSCAFKEALRMFPSLGFLARSCARRCVLPELGVTLDPGVGLFIPLQALHNDPQYFKEPDEFRPERFLPDAEPVDKFVYLPFGDGPRACIGERLGLMQSLLGLAAVLSRCSVAPAPGRPRRPPVDPRSGVVQTLIGGLPLLFTERPHVP